MIEKAIITENPGLSPALSSGTGNLPSFTKSFINKIFALK